MIDGFTRMVAHQALRVRWGRKLHYGLSLFAILFLALLNPWLCLLHCNMLSQEAPDQTIAQPNGAGFICLLGQTHRTQPDDSRYHINLHQGTGQVQAQAFYPMVLTGSVFIAMAWFWCLIFPASQAAYTPVFADPHVPPPRFF